jgi:hypothetical protein
MESQAGYLHNPLERAGYLESRGSQIYSVLHGVADPIARVLLVGPFASERFASYVPWVRWARYLASRRIEALRFDYRGVGESAGAFEDVSFDDWNHDVDFLAAWLKSQSPEVPLILHGLELGALLASKTYASGAGDALLLWSAPENANEVLRRPLSRHVFKNVYERKPLSDYIRQLEADQPLEVEGYPWSGKLWRESLKFETPLGRSAEPSADTDGRPVKFVNLDTGPASKLKGSAMGYAVSLNLDLSDLFADSFGWMANTLGHHVGSARGGDPEILH